MNGATASFPESFDAFLCYSGRDWEFANALHRYLTDVGFKVFLDSEALRTGLEEAETPQLTTRTSSPGMMREILAAVRNSRVFVLLVTPEALDSSWVQVELAERKEGSRVFVDLEWAEIPKVFDEGATHVNLQPGDLGRSAYERRYRRGLSQLCSLLDGNKATGRTVDHLRPPVPIDQAMRLPESIRRDLVKALTPLVVTTGDKGHHVRTGLCAALGILDGEFAASFQRRPMCDHAALLVNHLLVCLTRKLSPWRAAAHLAHVLHDGFLLPPNMRAKMREIEHESEVRISPDIDDEFVARVQDVLWPRYSVSNVLGGSSTITLRARDHDLDRDVAIKVLRSVSPPEVDHERKLAFQELTRHAARARCSGLGRIYGARFGIRGIHLSVAEFAPGESLARVVRCDSRIQTDELASLLARLGAVLADIESSKHVHLELSSHSVFATADQTVTVLPLGIVELGRKCEHLVAFYRQIRDECDVTEISGAVPLTPSIMQFGLGQIAIDLLIGERERSADHSLTVEQHLAKALEPGPGVSRLIRVLGQLHAPDPNDRFRNMTSAVEALADALRACRHARAHTFAKVLHRASIIRQEEHRLHALVQESLARALHHDLVPTFRKRLWSHDDIRCLFERQGAHKRIPEYEDKLRIALRTIAVYGAHDGYRPLKIDEIGRSHDGFDVAPAMYDVFRDELIAALRECDPEINRLHGTGKSILHGWLVTLNHVIKLLVRPGPYVLLPRPHDEAQPAINLGVLAVPKE